LVSFFGAMANTIDIPKTHLIVGLSLPLAVLLGYFIAEPMNLGSMAVVLFVLVVLAVPLMMRWHYTLLVFTWNAAIAPAFLPGQPKLWALLAFVGLFFAVLSRAITAKARFLSEPSVTKPLLVLAAVVIGTGLLTKGIGFHMLKSGTYGGRHYFYFVAAVAGYFVLTSRRVQPERAGLYVALFFLSGLTGVFNVLAGLSSARYSYLWLLFPPANTMTENAARALPVGIEPILRLSELAGVGGAIFFFMMARYGIRDVLDLTRPWRLLLFGAALVVGMMSGFRSFLLLLAITSVILFCMEGLHRTRYLPILFGVLLLGAALVLPQADKLPVVVQRTLSFLPGKFDVFAVESSAASTEWRVQMWKQVLPEVPNCLFRGRGWGIDSRQFFATVEIQDRMDGLAGTILVGNFHNGPLSLIMPFGLYGFLAFTWLLWAGLRLLYRNWKFGSPELYQLNTLLLAAFAGQAIYFYFFFGSLESDLPIFLGYLGLSTALNGPVAAAAPVEPAAAGVNLETEYIRA
jgi:hypothetical protein